MKVLTAGILLGAALVAQSCVDNEKDMSQAAEPKTTDLNVPADFDWSTTRTVELEISAPLASVVDVYTDADCGEASKIATLPVSHEKTVRAALTVPASVRLLFVKYPTGEQTTEVATVDIDDNSTLSRAAGSSAKAFARVEADDLNGLYSQEEHSDKNGTYVYITSGTVAFEDSWPELGDYDLNDLVAWYRIAHYKTDETGGNNLSARVDVTIGICAIGGYLPSQLGFRFVNKGEGGVMSQGCIERYEGLGTQNNGLTVKLANADRPDEAPVFIIDNLGSIKNGEMYFNTQKENGKQQMFSVNFSIHAKPLSDEENYVKFMSGTAGENQDFFVVSNGKEIHLRGYEPTSAYTTYDEDAATGKDVVMGSLPYTTDQNFVWGVKIPSLFQYPLERVDVCQAYAPHFRQWVESSGNWEYSNWFKKGTPGRIAGWW